MNTFFLILIPFLPLQEAPKQPRPVEIKFDTAELFGWQKRQDKWIHLAGITFDAYTTYEALSRPGFEEANPLIDIENGDSFGEIFVRMAALDLISTHLIHRATRKSGIKGWKITFGWHTGAGLLNIYTMEKAR